MHPKPCAITITGALDDDGPTGRNTEAAQRIP
jgi:hypothetical protein